MSGIIGAVFIITLLNCVFGAIDQLIQAVQRRRKSA